MDERELTTALSKEVNVLLTVKLMLRTLTGVRMLPIQYSITLSYCSIDSANRFHSVKSQNVDIAAISRLKTPTVNANTCSIALPTSNLKLLITMRTLLLARLVASLQ